MFKSYSLSCRDITKQWILIDAKDVVLGRLAVIIANRLRGKHQVNHTRHMDAGDNIVVINAKHVKLTGRKASDKDGKKYYWHTGHPGGIKEVSARDVLAGKFPERVIKKAVERMMPYCALSDTQLKNLYVYPEAEHKHQPQQPLILDVASLNAKNKR